MFCIFHSICLFLSYACNRIYWSISYLLSTPHTSSNTENSWIWIFTQINLKVYEVVENASLWQSTWLTYVVLGLILIIAGGRKKIYKIVCIFKWQLIVQDKKIVLNFPIFTVQAPPDPVRKTFINIAYDSSM